MRKIDPVSGKEPSVPEDKKLEGELAASLDSELEAMADNSHISEAAQRAINSKNEQLRTQKSQKKWPTPRVVQTFNGESVEDAQKRYDTEYSAERPYTRTPPATRVRRAEKIAKKLAVKAVVGGDTTSYYPIEIQHPLDPKRKPYVAECLDIIEALGMSYAEGTAFKALWRRCAVRQGLYRRDTTDAEKLTFMSQRILDDVITPKGKKA
jgi:hypothetical protein